MPQPPRPPDPEPVEPAPAPPEDWRPKPPPPAPPPKRKSALAPFVRVAPWAALVAILFIVAAAVQGGALGGLGGALRELHAAALKGAAGAPGAPALPPCDPGIGPCPELAPPGGIDQQKAAALAPRGAEPAGALTLRSDKPVRVLVDGVEIGRTPIEGLPLAAGEHLVRIVNVRHKSRAKELVVEVPEGGTLALEEKSP